MTSLRDLPIAVFGLSLALFWFSAQFGVFLRQKLRVVEEDERKDLGTVEAASLTLLGLIIAFSFSMAVTRYDQRKQCEAEEANAIGTEYFRADLLPQSHAEKARDLLKQWLRQRVAFYEARREDDLPTIETKTSRLEVDLWSTVREVADARPTFPVTLAVSGMNDVLNDRGYTDASWLNRIPGAAWAFMASLAILCNVLIGYAAHRTSPYLFVVLPLALSISFFLVADIDSPRGGVIRVLPINLLRLEQSLQAPIDSK